MGKAILITVVVVILLAGFGSCGFSLFTGLIGGIFGLITGIVGAVIGVMAGLLGGLVGLAAGVFALAVPFAAIALIIVGLVCLFKLV